MRLYGVLIGSWNGVSHNSRLRCSGGGQTQHAEAEQKEGGKETLHAAKIQRVRKTSILTTGPLGVVPGFLHVGITNLNVLF